MPEKVEMRKVFLTETKPKTVPKPPTWRMISVGSVRLVDAFEHQEVKNQTQLCTKERCWKPCFAFSLRFQNM